MRTYRERAKGLSAEEVVARARAKSRQYYSENRDVIAIKRADYWREYYENVTKPKKEARDAQEH